VATSNHYLRAAKGFARWLVNNERLYRNPLISLSLLNTRTDRRHDRRALSQEEFRRLIEAAETGPPIEGVPGRDRAILYLLAAWTGLRRGELGSLTKRSFRLDADPPTVKVEAAYSKRRREDVVILHPSIADRVRRYLARGEFASKEVLFPICHQSSGLYRKSSKMIQLDLAAARNQWLYELDDRSEGERSDFLAYKNQEGKYADFHCLRHTFITNLCRANVSPKIAQTLARHSDIQLTMNVYTHVDREEQVAAIGKLDGLG
jgi:integrase